MSTEAAGDTTEVQSAADRIVAVMTDHRTRAWLLHGMVGVVLLFVLVGLGGGAVSAGLSMPTSEERDYHPAVIAATLSAGAAAAALALLGFYLSGQFPYARIYLRRAERRPPIDWRQGAVGFVQSLLAGGVLLGVGIAIGRACGE